MSIVILAPSTVRSPVNVPPASGKKGPVPPPDPSTYALVTKLAAFTGVIPDTKPVNYPVPATCNLAVGDVLPIPTLPSFLNVTFCEPSKKKPKSESFAPCLMLAI